VISGERVSLHNDDLDRGVTYGRWDRDPEGGFVVPEGTSYSDYSGGMHNRANYDEFVEEFAEYEGTEWAGARGGHGTLAVVVRFDADERVPEIGEFFAALEDYPVANDERLSDLEQEAIEEAWNDWGANEFLEKIVKLDPDLEGDADFDDDGSAVGRLRNAVEQAASESPYVEDAAGGVSFRPNYSVLERIHREDPNALSVALELAREPGAEQALEYLVSEMVSWGRSPRPGPRRAMPAFYYALLNFHPVAARILGTRPNAVEFAEAYADETENSWLEVARMMAAELERIDESQIQVLADVVEEGDTEKAIEMLEYRGRR
jgi:hypothetical protein